MFFFQSTKIFEPLHWGNSLFIVIKNSKTLNIAVMAHNSFWLIEISQISPQTTWPLALKCTGTINWPSYKTKILQNISFTGHGRFCLAEIWNMYELLLLSRGASVDFTEPVKSWIIVIYQLRAWQDKINWTTS
jgi:hypothetical protein